MSLQDKNNNDKDTKVLIKNFISSNQRKRKNLIGEIESRIDSIFHLGNELFKEVNLFIIPRIDYPIKEKSLKIIKELNGKFRISLFKIPKISSSNIRESINYSGLPKCLIPIIKKNNLYSLYKKIKQ